MTRSEAKPNKSELYFTSETKPNQIRNQEMGSWNRRKNSDPKRPQSMKNTFNFHDMIISMS